MAKKTWTLLTGKEYKLLKKLLNLGLPVSKLANSDLTTRSYNTIRRIKETNTFREYKKLVSEETQALSVETSLIRKKTETPSSEEREVTQQSNKLLIRLLIEQYNQVLAQLKAIEYNTRKSTSDNKPVDSD